MELEKMTDEQLIRLTQQGDDFAFTVLFKRFQGALSYNAKSAAGRYPFIEEDFFEYFQERFEDIVRKFDFRGTIFFATYCKVMFPKFTTEFVRDKLRKKVRDEEGVRRRTEEPSGLAIAKSVETIVETEFIEVNSKLTYEYLISETGTDLFRYLQVKNETYAKIASLLAQGYNYVEVATILGRDGDIPSKKDWVKYQVRGLRAEAIRFYNFSGASDEIKEYIV